MKTNYLSNTPLILPVVFLLILLMAFSAKTKPKKVIFFGDSITEVAVREGGYIDQLNKMFLQKGLQDHFDLIGAGISGNKVYDLYLRLEEDVISKKPDVVVIYVGINDVWHKAWGTGTDEAKFEKFYKVLIEKIKAQGAEVILCTPTLIGEKNDFSNPQDGDLNQYALIVRQLAMEYNCSLCDLRNIFLAYNLEHNHNNSELGILTTDRVHLNEKGNQLVASALIELLMIK
ncbi:MAG: hypothetical protein K0B15_00620 [Lentimicrobium sp.]|nr:hypothetical protein [Lentimicrobium sp.]